MMKMKKGQSEVRNIKRHGQKSREIIDYIDNKGQGYDYKWLAKVVSFLNFVGGGLRSGFPVIVSKLRYPAWAFYPFFFIRKDLAVEKPVIILNHERIHIHQQRELITAALPVILVLMFTSTWEWIVLLPFVPTIFYWLNVIGIVLTIGKKVPYSEIRRRTCFELESERFASDWDYLLYRKAFHNFRFLNYKKYTR